MKRILSIIVALILALSLTVGLAEEAAEKPDLSTIEVPDYKSMKDEPEEKVEDTHKSSITRDIVTINNGQYKVVTPEGIRFTYTATDSSFALTQDLIQQADLFVAIYNDPMAVVSHWMENGTHLNIYDFQDKVDIYAHVVETGLAKLYPESTRLSQSDADYILSFMANSPRYFQGASDTTCGWIGSNVWFLGDMRNVDGTVTLVSFVGGKEIFAYGSVSSDAQYDCLIGHLQNLVIETA